MSKRPGQATTQYGDIKGEICADLQESSSLEELSKELGWKKGGRVVGMELSMSENRHNKSIDGCFNVTLQITEEYDIEKIRKEIKDSDGSLCVREVIFSKVDVATIFKLFKRLEIGLLIKSLKPERIEVVETFLE